MSAFDDYLSAPAAPAQGQSFDAYVGAAPAAAPVPASAAGGAGAVAGQPAAGQPGVLASLGAGLGRGVQQAALGAQQLIGHGLQSLSTVGADKMTPQGQGVMGAIGSAGNWLTNDANQGIQSGAQQVAPYQAAHPVATTVGDVGGQIAGTAPTLLLGPEYAGLSLGGRLGLGAAQGAAGAALQPVQDQSGNFWAQKAGQAALGGALGSATPLVAAGARAAGQGLWNVAQPVVQPGRYVGQGIANAMDQGEAAQAASNIRGAPQFVPGSVPTTAQVAQTPVMVQTEKAAGNIPAFKTAFEQRAIDNNDARWSALMGVAQDPATLQAAQAARAQAAQPLYDAAHSATANVGPGFMRKAQIPEMQQAMQQAEDLARLQAQTGRGIPAVWPTPPTPGVSGTGSKTINGAALDYTSRALGDMVGAARSANQPAKAGALSDLKDWVDQWAGQYVPGVQQARQAYAQASVPINTMEVGQSIANNLGTRTMGAQGGAGGVAPIQLMPFRSALTSAMGSGNAGKFGIDPNALNTLQGIGQDLQRATVSNSIKSPGSDTAYNLAANGWLARQLYGPTFGGAGNIGKAAASLGATLYGGPMAGGATLFGANRLGQMVGGRLQNRLTGLLMDPNAILPYLDTRAAAPAQQIQGQLMQGLLNYGRPAVLNGLLGGINDSGNK